MRTLVEVFATEDGEFLGEAYYEGDVAIADVTSDDPTHPEYTALRHSGETTEIFRFAGGEGKIFYGFEYFVRFPLKQLH